MLKGMKMNLLLSNWFFYHKQSRALFCLQEKGITQSILILDISRTVLRLRSPVNLHVYFKFAFGILFPST